MTFYRGIFGRSRRFIAGKTGRKKGKKHQNPPLVYGIENVYKPKRARKPKKTPRRETPMQ